MAGRLRTNIAAIRDARAEIPFSEKRVCFVIENVYKGGRDQWKSLSW